MRILSVSTNTDSLLASDDLLAMAGVAVVSPKTPKQTPHLLAERDVDAVVIEDSVPAEERSAVISAIREVRSDVLLVFVYRGPLSDPEPRADISLDISQGLSAVIDTLSHL